MNKAKIWSAILFTVGSSDSSILYWRNVIGLTYTEAIIVVVIITFFSSTGIFTASWLLNQFFAFIFDRYIRENRFYVFISSKFRRKKRMSSRWRATQKILILSRFFRRKVVVRAAKYGPPAVVAVCAFWPTIFGGIEVHVPVLVMAGRTGRIDLLVAYLIGNTLRITATGYFFGAIEWLWHAIF